MSAATADKQQGQKLMPLGLDRARAGIQVGQELHKGSFRKVRLKLGKVRDRVKVKLVKLGSKLSIELELWLHGIRLG